MECGIFYRLPKMLIHSNPQTGLEGKFSLEFCIALALQERKASLAHFTDSKVKEPGIQKLIKKIRKEVTDEAGGKGTDLADGDPEVRMKNGTTYPCRVKTRKGSPKSPLSAQEVMNKFLECAQLNYSLQQSRRIAEAVMEMEKAEDIRELVRLFLSCCIRRIRV